MASYLGEPSRRIGFWIAAAVLVFFALGASALLPHPPGVPRVSPGHLLLASVVGT